MCERELGWVGVVSVLVRRLIGWRDLHAGGGEVFVIIRPREKVGAILFLLVNYDGAILLNWVTMIPIPTTFLVIPTSPHPFCFCAKRPNNLMSSGSMASQLRSHMKGMY